MIKVPNVMSVDSIKGERVVNNHDEDLGSIEELMIDIDSGRIAYAVLSFGGFLGMRNKLFAIPWSALVIRPEDHQFVLDIARERLEQAPGFDRENWPDMTDLDWGAGVYSYYGLSPYWM